MGARGLAIAAMGALLLGLSGGPTGAAPVADPGRVTGSPAAVRAESPEATPRTTFSVSRPWTDGSARRAISAKSTTRTSASCIDSGVSGRNDAFRCFVGDLIYDPCFVNPRSSHQVACPDTSRRSGWLVATNVTTSRESRGVSPTSGGIYQVRLTNGAVCARSTGAFPEGPQSWPDAAGVCRGGHFGGDYLFWRSGPKSAKSTAYAPLVSAGAGRWAAAVESASGRVALYPVRSAVR